MIPDDASARHRRQRRWIAGLVVLGVGLSLGMSFAAVPLYRAFCQATGFGGTTQVASGPAAQRGTRVLNVRFDANVAPGLAWRFEPETPQISLRTGQTATVFFKVRNLSDRDTVAEAQYNVTPDVAGEWFDKIACFCFNQQHLGPNEAAELPVVFFLNPDLESDETMKAVDTLTLSYTFFAPPKASRAGSANRPVAAAGDGKSKL